MANAEREAWITGVGIVSNLGEGAEAHWQKLIAAQPAPDTTAFAPYVVHPLAPVNFDLQIPKKGDQRQMENWQRIGTYAAGLALDSAGVKGNRDILSHMDMIVAAGGGERDLAVDATILSGMPHAPNKAAYLNEHLMSDLRPTLFLAQLSNLLAGNISIVHGVTGSSRTFMGEESAGVDALRIAQARVASGQIDAILVGGSYSAERPDVLVIHEMGDYLARDAFRPVFARGDKGGEAGFILGSCAAFLMLESAAHAAARGARALAQLEPVASDRTRRAPGSVAVSLETLWGQAGLSAPDHVLSGATGVAPITAEERTVLTKLAPCARLRALVRVCACVCAYVRAQARVPRAA